MDETLAAGETFLEGTSPCAEAGFGITEEDLG